MTNVTTVYEEHKTIMRRALIDPVTNETVFTFLSEFNKPSTGRLNCVFLNVIKDVKTYNMVE